MRAKKCIIQIQFICLDRQKIVKLLIKKGLKVNAVDNEGKTPLHCIAEEGNSYRVNFLQESYFEIFYTKI